MSKEKAIVHINNVSKMIGSKRIKLSEGMAIHIQNEFVGALIFEGIRSLANSNEPAKKVGTSILTEKGHDYLVVDTKHGVCVIHAASCPCNKKK